MILNSPLKKALAILELALQQPKDEFIRDAVIQRFEYCYELAWKTIRRYLADDVGSETLAPLSRKDLFRLAADKQLIADPVLWFKYHHARNSTSHTYDEATAELVYQAAVAFYEDAIKLLQELEQRHAAD